MNICMSQIIYEIISQSVEYEKVFLCLTSLSSNNSLHSNAKDSEYFSLNGEKSKRKTQSLVSRTTSKISMRINKNN